MECALGLLGLSPSEFWSMTPVEFWAAYYGKVGREKVAAPPTKKEIGEWIAKSEARKRRDGNRA